MALKVVLMMTLLVLFSLGSMHATTIHVSELLAGIDTNGKESEGFRWCDSCTICTYSIPPYCSCSDASQCTKCVCFITVSPKLKPMCDSSLASKFVQYCRPTTTAERT